MTNVMSQVALKKRATVAMTACIQGVKYDDS